MESHTKIDQTDAPQKQSEQAARISSPIRRMVTGVALFLFVCLVAVAGYLAAGWRLDDAIYMVVITIFGVGYGEVQPIESPSLRALTITVIIAGYGAVIYTIGGFMQMLIDGELNRAMGARRMTRDIDRLAGHTIICGIGRLGNILAKELHAQQMPFVAIDTDPDRLRDASKRGYLVIEGDATEDDVLEQAGIRRAATVASVLSLDATNVFVTITARELNPEVEIIARGEHPRTERKLLGCGADQVVLPTAIGAQKIAQMITRPTAERILNQIQSQSALLDDLDQIGLQFSELAVGPGSDLVDAALTEIELRGNHGFLIVGVRRADGTMQLNPSPDLVLHCDDVVIVLGHENDLPDVARKFMSQQPKMTYRGASVER